MSTIAESIDILTRLSAKASEWKQRYTVELLAYHDVLHTTRRVLPDPHEAMWYDAAYQEALLKREMEHIDQREGEP